MDNDDAVLVEQCDRDAAEAYLREADPEATWDNEGREARMEMERVAIGTADDHPIVQLLAKHRTAQLAERDAELARLREWRDISTAPTDGTRILTAGSVVGRCVASAGWRNDAPDVIYWEITNGIVIEPTHWLPLPAALTIKDNSNEG